MDLKLVCHYVLPVIFIWAQASSSVETYGVRLVNGPSHYEGTVEYSAGGEKWNTLCGQRTDLNEVKVVCRQLGFPGANRYMKISPFESLSSQPTTSFSCIGNETLLEQCQFNSLCSAPKTPVSAKCYDERYLGCFNDTGQDRIFPADNRLISITMTIQMCIGYCKYSNISYAYAGVEYSSECYCGVANASYSRHGEGDDTDCQYRCSGDMTSSCGGLGFIAVFDLNVSVITNSTPSSTVPSTTTVTQTADQEMSTLSSDPTTSTGVQSTLMSSLQPVSGDKIDIALYAGAGGGGAFLLIIIIIIIVFVTCRRRNTEKRSPATDHPLTTMIASKDDNQTLSRPADEKEDPCYDNKSAEAERDYQNMTVVDTREYVNFPEVMDNKELTYMNSEKRSDMKEATPGPAALYAMPDLSGKTAFRPKTYTSPPTDTDNPSSLYAMPDRKAKTVYSRNGKPALEEDTLHGLYTTSMKNRLEPIGMEASTDGEGLYALPDKKPRDHVTQNGAGTRDGVEAMYAMPDRSRGGNDVDNTEMIENDIYSSTQNV